MSNRPVVQWKVLFATMIVLILVTSSAIFIHSRYIRKDNDSPVPETVCDTFNARQIEQVSGKSVVFENFGRSSSLEYDPDFSCQLSLEHFGQVKIGYIDTSWFRDGPSSRITENDLLNLGKNYKWTIEEMNIGLDGKSYIAISPKRESVVAYGAWYSSSGRTFSIAVYDLDDTSIADENIKEIVTPLMSYLIPAIQTRFPAAARVTNSTFS